MSYDGMPHYEAEISPQNRLNALLKLTMGRFSVGNMLGYSTNDTIIYSLGIAQDKPK